MKRALFESLLATLPGIASSVKWKDDLVYTVGGKMFAVLVIRGINCGQSAFKAGPDRFLELTARPGVLPAPYLARHHWVSVVDDSSLSEDEWPALLRDSYQQVRDKLSRRLREGLAAESRF